MTWYEDPKRARTLGRLSWMVLVAGFVIGTRFVGDGPERAAIATLLVLVVGVMSAPTALGLWHTREQSHSAMYRWLALSFLLRLAAIGWVAWMLVA